MAQLHNPPGTSDTHTKSTAKWRLHSAGSLARHLYCIHYSIICLYRMFKSVFQSCLHNSVPAIVIPIYFLSLNLFSCSSPPVTQAPSLDRITIFITLSHSFSLHAPCPAAGEQTAALPFTAVYQSYVSVTVQHLATFRTTLYSKSSKEPRLQLSLHVHNVNTLLK